MSNWNKAATQKLTDGEELINKLDEDIQMKRAQMREDEAVAQQRSSTGRYDRAAIDKAVEEEWESYEYPDEVAEKIQDADRYAQSLSNVTVSGILPDTPFGNYILHNKSIPTDKTLADPSLFTSVQDSGKRQAFDTGSVRDTEEGKGRFDLIPPYVLMRLAQHYQNGAIKYGENNWRKGQPLMRYYSSTLRHLMKWSLGWTDEDHLLAAIWNLFCIVDHLYQISLGKLPATLDNRYKD